ncbi:MAG: site-specific DNA-methyltransferase [Proteobacteria bacterium]|nr:site-specific DNA-methyltransferase [Pseudomonadota bacterium]
MTASQPFTTTLIGSNLPLFKYCWVWQKNYGSNFAVARKQPFKEHEDVCVFYRKQPTYLPIMEPRSESGKKFVENCNYEKRSSDHSSMTSGKANRDPDWRLPGSVKQFNMQVGKHPTQKPVALMEYMIKTYTQPGALILDFTMGSGTTGVACQNTGRNFIGIELDADYFKIAQERIL